MNQLFLKTEKTVTLDTIGVLRSLLKKTIESIIPETSIRNQLLLCFSEVATNIVLHSNAKLISLYFGRSNDYWWIKVLDDGLPWDPTLHKESLPLDFELDESGRGTSLLHSQCKKMEYISSNTGNKSSPNRLKLYWDIPKAKSLSNILIVDDDQSLLRIYSAYLKNAFEVTTAISGADALKKIKINPIDLVLSDINMPDMDGFALRKQLNKLPHSALIPFIFLTGNDTQELQNDATNLGIDDYIVKPANKSQLVNTINRVLSRSQQVYQQLTDRINESITSSLQPRLPDVAHNWRLCTEKRHTGIGGGDLLLHQNDASHLKLVLVDIMGHDDNAKFFAYAYGGYLRGLMQSSGADISPSDLLSRLSENALKDELFSQVILTSCVIDLFANGNLVLASAGHPPPLLISNAGLKPLTTGGMLPGLVPDTKYESESLKLAQGERLAIFTDGLFDSAADSNTRDILEDNIKKVLLETLERPIEDSLTEVMTVFDDLTSKKPTDDAMLILIEPDRKN